MTHGRPDVRDATLPDGLTLQYVEQGDPDGVPVVLLHGILDSYWSYSTVLEHLPSSIHAFAVTQRGHGDSDHPDTSYNMEEFAGDAVAFVDAVGLRSAILVGHSMGSVIALRTAINYPDHVSGLVLIGAPFTPLQNHPDLRELWETVVSSMEDPVPPEFVHEFQSSTLAQPVPEAFFSKVISESLKVPAHVLRNAMHGAMTADPTGELTKVDVPTLLVWGDQDAMISREDQDGLRDGIRDCRLIVYSGAGHGTHWEEPERFANDLVMFVESISEGQAS